MKPAHLWTLPILGVALALPAGAQRIGEKVDVDFDDFTQTGARSLDDYQGRAVLIEYFAYW